MTTIAFDGALLVADTLCCWVNIKEQRVVTKIQFSKGRYFAVAGTDGLMQYLIDWFEKGADVGKLPATPHGWTLAVVERRGGEWVSTQYDNGQPHGCAMPAKWAIGTGKEFALGAMHVGASALDAVSAARDLDVHTGGPLQWFSVTTPIKRGQQAKKFCSDAAYNSKERV